MSKIEKPLYQTIEDYVIERIDQRILVEGDPIPTEKEFCDIFDTSRSTVNKALNNLVNKGIIYRTAGRGSFVRMRSYEHQVSKLLGFKEQMQMMKQESSTKILSFSQVSASVHKNLADLLGLNEDEFVYRIERIRYINGDPIAIEVISLSPRVFRNLELKDIEYSLYEYIEKKLGLKIGHANFTIRAFEATDELRRLFPVPVTVPILKYEQTTYLMDGRLFELDEIYYLSDKYQYTGTNYR
jgi:DNA-binding GntR family transcriptional regulator